MLAEGEYESHSYGSGESEYSGIDWNYTPEEAAATDAELLDTLRAAVPGGLASLHGRGNRRRSHVGRPEGGQRPPGVRSTFGYFGLPDTYRILIATADGDTYVFPPCTRTVLQSSVTVDWETKSVEIPPAWIGYVLQFLCTLLPTLVIEGVVLVLFGFSLETEPKAVFAGESRHPGGAGGVFFHNRRAKRRRILVLFPADSGGDRHCLRGGWTVHPPACRTESPPGLCLRHHRQPLLRPAGSF